MKTPFLSVCLITYNHEKYIEQAIEGVLMQKVNFSWELIIADDCSTDNTREIIEKYKAKYPDFIKLIFQEKNVGPAKNFFDLISSSKSKYMAYFEGDDYWTDSLKLQKQVDFLEANLDFEVCFTNMKIINSKGETIKNKLINDNRKTVYEHKDLPIWAPTLTRVFRNRDFKAIDCNVPGQDTLWLLYQSKFGKIKFINEVTATYRLHEDGVYSSKSVAKKKEHIILTDIISLKFIEKPLFLKYFGMMFKKVYELKALDNNLYRENKKRLINNYKLQVSKFTFVQHIKIRFCFLLISLPYFHKNLKTKNIIIKILNRLLIYK